MKLFFSEYNPNYSKYNFPYQVFAKREDKDLLGDLFSAGFLPTRINKDIFYLTRSSRINLAEFDLNSENRRINRKTEQFKFSLLPMSDFEYTPEVQKKSKDWFNERLGEKVLGALGIKTIYTESNNNYVFVWKLENEIVGYVVCLITESILHYNFAFYNPDYYKDNLGVRMMLAAIEYAKEKELSYAYLGSVYEQGSMYKAQYKGFEFFNGITWSANLDELKYLINRPVGSEEYLWRDEQYLGNYVNVQSLKELFENL
ncbi:GNAT family N-acetyltransferase [Candidatus Dojkabacteria bacterium]|uniref:GNAT family N-acetyltransferase n=1 Tax=Candidatus Dojkabacteria bacterium TaxID=2099670 RepID=A0A955RI79_9BACT|nr:GNAT family N-acetyltransferase [Candidatus Dojkabacteria bacterium]